MAVFIALEVKRRLYLEEQSVSLATLFKSMGAVPDVSDSLTGWKTRASRAVDVAHFYGSGRQPFSLVRGKDNWGDGRHGMILYNIDPTSLRRCALSVLSARLTTERVIHRLVAIQSKNATSSTVRDMLATLSPGLQFLDNAIRNNFFNRQFNFATDSGHTDLVCDPNF